MGDALDWCAGELERLEAGGLARHPVTISTATGPEVVIGGRRLLGLCSNDYLGLAGDPRLRQAAAQAAQAWGAGSGASRLVSGTTTAHRELERAIAALKGCEDAIVFSSGYLANVGTIAALVGKQDAVFSDALNHASVIDGCRLSAAALCVYRHGDPADLDQALAASRARRRLVVTDTVFSMEGDLAPLVDLAEVCARRGAMLMVDEAHATGLLGARGSGAVEAAGLTGEVGVAMGSLSKALGSAGGYVAGSSALVEWLRNRARTYMFDTAAPPAVIGATAVAVDLVRTEPQRRQKALAMALALAGELEALGYRVLPPAAAIVPVIVGATGDAMALSARLNAAGVLVPAIRPPSVPTGGARLRVTVSAAHTEDHLATAIEAFAQARPRPARGGANAGTRGRGTPGGRIRPRHGGIDPRILRAGGIFVTGTGTGVGKTVVAAALAQTLGRSGLAVGALKPAQTGTGEGADDLAFVRAAAGLARDRCRVPYELGTPLAPSVSARLVGASLEVAAVVDAFHSLREHCELVVVEGAGGLLAGFNETTTMAGIAAALGLPVVVVALPGLGTLNHSALTVEAARARGLDVLGVVLSRFPSGPGLAEATNPRELERVAATTVLGVVPELAGLDVDRGIVGASFAGGRAGAPSGAWMSPALGGTFDRYRFFESLEPCNDPA